MAEGVEAGTEAPRLGVPVAVAELAPEVSAATVDKTFPAPEALVARATVVRRAEWEARDAVAPQAAAAAQVARAPLGLVRALDAARIPSCSRP